MSPLKFTVATALAAGIAASAFAVESFGASRPALTAVQNISLTIRAGDRMVEPNIALAPGVPVRLSVRNFTHEFHTFTIPGLHVSALILPSHGHSPRTTIVAFTPHDAGVFAWHCTICPSGMHGHGHAMGGAVYVIIKPSTLP